MNYLLVEVLDAFLKTLASPLGLYYALAHYLWAVVVGWLRPVPLLKPRHVAVTGASSGIGEALVIRYAAQSHVERLTLFGRNAARLEHVAKLCRQAADNSKLVVQQVAVDVTNVALMEKETLRVDQDFPIDLLVVNAGVSGRQALGLKDDERTSADDFVYAMKPIMQVNIIGAVCTFQPLLQRFMDRRSGQIALVSSLAAFAPMASLPTYGTTKAALNHLSMSLRPVLARYNVKMSVICPGFVKSAMTRLVVEGKGLARKILSAEEAAEIIAHGLARNDPVIVFPLDTFFLSRFVSFLPWSLVEWFGTFIWKNDSTPGGELAGYYDL